MPTARSRSSSIKKLNILYLISYAGKAGTEKYVENLMRTYSAQGHRCFLAYMDGGELAEKAKAFGCGVFRLDLRAAHALAASKSIARLCAENGVEVRGKRLVVLGAGGVATAICVQAALDGETLVDPALFRADLVVADTVYNSRETRMIRGAKAAGCQAAVGGIGMLLWQGVAAFRLFTGRDMPAQEVLEKFFS